MALPITFDTFRFVKKLKDAGFPDQQAEALSDAFKDAQSETDIATKRDLEHLEMSLRNDLKTLELKLADTKSELIRWVVGAGFLQTALITALLLKLVK
jgi:hypothetical protein